VPHTRAEKISFFTISIARSFPRIPYAFHRARDSRNLSHGNKERRVKRATFVHVRTCVVQVARGTFRREETSPRNDTMRSVPGVTRTVHNGVT